MPGGVAACCEVGRELDSRGVVAGDGCVDLESTVGDPILPTLFEPGKRDGTVPARSRRVGAGEVCDGCC